MAAKYAYMLKPAGKEKCIKNEFYLQETSVYKGYTEKIFDMLFKSKEPLTVREISMATGIRSISVSAVITFNIYAGYILRLPL
jgi:hypothetical protein